MIGTKAAPVLSKLEMTFLKVQYPFYCIKYQYKDDIRFTNILLKRYVDDCFIICNESINKQFIPNCMNTICNGIRQKETFISII